ncbi:MAG TPA: 3-hydroxyacyl-CoA dehydrogenase NAD-binding domain-containing protein [Novosphingobium sp.]|nr:3-hydroxyacyl-CoA dehydrogenase NAD-binding domain-containing protein [Novosphingobium sp.]
MPVEKKLSDGILHVTVLNPPVNALSREERAGIVEAMAAAQAPEVRAVIICGANNTFIAGADIREFGKEPEPPHLPEVVDAIEGCSRPVIAAIAGQALGGGLEIALGCHYRIAAPGARLGLPEVTLGIVPGAGGTQRLPRLIDPVAAATMVSGGKPVTAAQALASGLIDRIAEEGRLIEDAVQFAAEVADADLAARRLSGRGTADPAPLAEGFERLASTTRRQARGAEAPIAALELVKLATTTPFAEGAAKERETFLRLRAGGQAKALRHIFFAERAAAKPPADVRDAVARPVNRVGVIGAGTMGAGIAMSFADSGFPVTIVETSAEALARGSERIAQSYQASVKQGRISEAAAAERTALVQGSTDYEDLAGCDLIIEAAFEAVDVKRDIFQRLDAVARPGAILASNTSYLDLNEIAAFTSRPGDVVGMHYFSPANVMRLLEVVRGRDTAPDVLVTALAVAKRTGKVPVVAGVCNGFIGNRMLKAYVREAGLLLLEGATPEQVDGALTRFGMAMGPFAVADLSGIDIGYKARKAMAPGSYEPMATIVHDRLAEAGYLGRKTGSGFYLYEDGSKAAGINPEVPQIIADARQEAGVAQRKIDDAEIVDRCMLALANEGGFILDEGIAASSGDIDVVYVNGYGFPRHRGGPMFHAEQCGLETVRNRIAQFAEGPFGRWWQPSPFIAGQTG